MIFDPKESGPSGNHYLDCLVRILLSGHCLHQPPHTEHDHYIMRDQRIRLHDDNPIGKGQFTRGKIIECYDISLPLDEMIGDTTNSWYTFDFYIYERDRETWGRLDNGKVGFERNFTGEIYQGYLKLKLGAH